MSITPKPPQIIPYLFYRDVGAALDFLCRAFGFKEEMRTGTPSGGMHGEASFRGQLVMMGQGAHERSMRSPRDVNGATMGVFIYLDEVDTHYEVAVNRGGVRTLFVLAALTLALFPAVAGQPAALCAAAKKPVEADLQLATTVAMVFRGTIFRAAGEDCIYPLKVLHYATADVLVVQT